MSRICFWSLSHGEKFISNKIKIYIKQKFCVGLEFVFGPVLMVRTRVLGAPWDSHLCTSLQKAQSHLGDDHQDDVIDRDDDDHDDEEDHEEQDDNVE